MEHIYILVRPNTWEIAQKSRLFYEVSLANEGFIHACEWRQLDRVANAYFGDADPLVLAAINPARVKPPVRWEESRSTGDIYPHIYGPLNMDAVTEVLTLQRGEEGRFTIPANEPSLQL
jgi:uncharacterized protein (DUF952 family)